MSTKTVDARSLAKLSLGRALEARDDVVLASVPRRFRHPLRIRVVPAAVTPA